MAKPFADQAGTGAHFNMSLADIEQLAKNLFKDPNDPRGLGLAEIGYHFIGGLKAHGRGLMAAAAPTVNSYKRLVKRGQMGYYSWAPVFNNLGQNNRSNNYRVPMGGGRVECRGADSSCNPYLTAALMLAAGLDGIEQKLEPGEAISDNIYELSPDQKWQARGIELLPKSLEEAIEAFDRRSVVQRSAGRRVGGGICQYQAAAKPTIITTLFPNGKCSVTRASFKLVFLCHISIKAALICGPPLSN